MMWENVLYVRDVNGNNLAGFWCLGTDRVLGWPTEAGFALSQNNPGTPLYVRPGTLYTASAFLGYLAGVASTDKGDGLECSAASGRDTLRLTRHMRASQIAQLTGFDPVAVRATLIDHLTFAGA